MTSHTLPRAIVLGSLFLLPFRGCDVTGPPPGIVITGTWGGDNAGLIADDSTAHVHIVCTYGNIPKPIVLDVNRRFDVPGEYVLRAYPVAVGPSLPARFHGTVLGRVLTLRVTVTDTTAAEDSTVTLGPVRLLLGQEPAMQACPICRTPRGRTTN